MKGMVVTNEGNGGKEWREWWGGMKRMVGRNGGNGGEE